MKKIMLTIFSLFLEKTKVYGLHGLTSSFFTNLWKTFHFWTFLKMSKNKNLCAFYKISKNDFSGVQSVEIRESVYAHMCLICSKNRETEVFVIFMRFLYYKVRAFLDIFWKFAHFWTFFGRSRFWTFLKSEKHASPKTCNLARRLWTYSRNSLHTW